MLKSSLVAAAAAMTVFAAGAQQVETRAHYSTNPGNAVGRAASITIDGEFTDWSDDMIIATCGANDMATAFKGSHENCVVDMYALYAAWDDSNLYLAWQMCNTGDTWAREGDGPLTDYGRIGNVPIVVALSLDPSSTGMTGKLTSGKSVWMDDSAGGLTFETHVDRLLYMSAQVGQGSPAMFKAVDAQGNTSYAEGTGFVSFKTAGITYAMKEGFAPSHLWRQNTTAKWATPTELLSDPEIYRNIYSSECYDNLLAGPVAGLKDHDTKFDSFFELKIPFASLGINRQWLEANGLCVRVIGTRGESAIDCIPFDACVTDNIFGEYAKDNSTTHEKDDWDNFTYAMASVGKIRDIEHVEPLPEPDPIEPDPENPENPEDPDTPAVDDKIYFATAEYNVYLDADAAGWTAANAYIWDAGRDNVQVAGAWPGAAMTEVIFEGKNYFKYSFDSADALVTPMVIFNGGGSQTKDLEFHNNGIYTLDGYTSADIDPADVPKKPLGGVESVSAGSAAFAVDGLTVRADGFVAVYNMQGVCVASGNGEATAPAGGLYVVTVGGMAFKIAL